MYKIEYYDKKKKPEYPENAKETLKRQIDKIWNIKAITIDTKDVEMMELSNDPYLRILNRKYKFRKGNGDVLYIEKKYFDNADYIEGIIDATWLINADNIPQVNAQLLDELTNKQKELFNRYWLYVVQLGYEKSEGVSKRIQNDIERTNNEIRLLEYYTNTIISNNTNVLNEECETLRTKLNIKKL